MASEYGDFLPQDYLAVQVNEAVSTATNASQSSAINSTGTTDGQVAIWVSPNYVAGTINSGDGIALGYTSTPAPSLTFSVNNAASLRSVLGLSIKAISAGTFSANPGSIAATSTGTVTATITGAAVGDVVTLGRPAGLDDDLIFSGCRVTAADTLTIYLYNPTAAPIDDSAQSWDYVWLDVS